MRGNEVVDLERRDLLPTARDDLLAAADEFDTAVGAQARKVASAEITVRERRLGDPLGDAMVQLWAVRRLAENVGQKGGEKAGFWNRVARGMAVHGGYVAGGPVGAMLAGMLPIALAWGEAGQQTAPLGRAVIGGLLAGWAALLLLPVIT